MKNIFHLFSSKNSNFQRIVKIQNNLKKIFQRKEFVIAERA